MDSALLYAYMFDVGWFLLLTGALMLVAMISIFLCGDLWDPANYELDKERKV
jgi:hypothetical protein